MDLFLHIALRTFQNGGTGFLTSPKTIMRPALELVSLWVVFLLKFPGLALFGSLLSGCYCNFMYGICCSLLFLFFWQVIQVYWSSWQGICHHILFSRYVFHSKFKSCQVFYPSSYDSSSRFDTGPVAHGRAVSFYYKLLVGPMSLATIFNFFLAFPFFITYIFS